MFSKQRLMFSKYRWMFSKDRSKVVHIMWFNKDGL